MGNIWTNSAARYLSDREICPRCDARLVESRWCPTCGAELSGPLGRELAAASHQASVALTLRQSIIDRLPTVWAAVPGTATAPHPGVAPGPADTVPAQPASVAPADAPTSQISVQSVLAVAGAGLLAVAALVFTFLNPDLTSFTVRTLITGVMTVAFLGGAWFFARKGLQFSAESVGALGAVFVVLDIWAFAQVAPAGASPFVFAGIGTLLGAAALLFTGARARVRAWVWSSIVGFAFTPALFASAGGSPWSPVVASLVVAFVVLGLHVVVHALAPRFGAALGVERVTATVIQIVAVVVAPLQLLLLSLPIGSARIFGTAGILACLAVVAALGSRNGLPRFWSFVAGALAVSAIGVLPFALPLADAAGYVALAPAATGITVVGLSALRSATTASRSALVNGAWTVGLVSAAPALIIATQQLFSPILPLAARLGGQDAGQVALVPPSPGMATIIGVACLAATAGAVALVARRSPVAPAPASVAPAGIVTPGAVTARGFALWLSMLTLLTVTGWSGFDWTTQAIVGLILAAAISAALVRMRRLVGAAASLRAPLIVGAHLLLILAATIGWIDPGTSVAVGAAAVLVLTVVAQARPTRWRPLYFGVGYAYSLVVFAAALNLANVDNIAVLCLTTTLASLFALGVTLTRWLSPRGWYATLIVTAAPFLIGVFAVLLVRSGWTALSTGVTFALALALVVTRRPGMTRLLRSAAAALLVPSLSVVVVCLGAQLLDVSGSPVVLPVIAAIVACILPATALIAEALTRHGIPTVEADAARNWIEISALLTAALAVLLALVRSAAGLQTTFLVLVILGAGAAASALTTRRRYAWWAAAASWTGALWCVWAIEGISVVEPYLLPPALAAVIVGAIFVARGRNGLGLYATGLAVAVVPSVIVLAVTGSGGASAAGVAAGSVPWRAWGLLAGALLLVLVLAILGGWMRRRPLSSRLASLAALRGPTAIIGATAASAGAVQAVRWGLEFDRLVLANPAQVMIPVLGFSVLATALAAAAAFLRGERMPAEPAALAPSRWRYAAATAFLAAGPITAIRWHPLSIATLLLLTLLLLGFMLVVAVRARTRAVSLPPVWFIFGLAWCTAVAGWSQRELRVEAFSLPLGLALLAAGVIAMQPGARPTTNAVTGVRHGWTTWPNGFDGSWQLLTPGIVVTFLPSVLATGTDPQTWRAILVMSLALAAILVGSVQRLAAPFILSLSVLPIEIIVVFMVQIGQRINPLLWWITLAAAGGVLLVIAITSERKGSEGAGITARLRDLS
jgi:hypothetical protein